jgi:PAS domain S-box-containing protein
MRKDGTITRSSLRWRAFTGIDQSVCDPATWLDVIHPEDRERVVRETHIALGGTDTHEMTFRARRVDGEYRWMRRRTMPVHDAEGRLVEWVGFSMDISEAREAESEGRLLQQLVDTTPNLITLCGADGRLRYMNPAGRELVGIAPDADLSLVRTADYTAPESRGLLENVVIPTARDLGIWEGEMQLINRRTGAVIDIQRITQGLRDSDGRHIGFSTVTRNITDAKRARAALAESERQFRSTFEQAAVGIAHVGLDGRWLLVNARLCEILGYSESDLQQLTFQQLTHPDDLASDLTQVEALLAGTLKTYVMEKRYRHRDGHMVWTNLTVALQRDEAGAPNRFISVVEDIADRRAMEAALQDSMARFRNLVEALPQMAFVTGPDGQVAFHNRRWSDYSGLSLDSSMGRRWLNFLHPEDALVSAAAWNRAVRTADPFGIEHRLRAADGSYRWFLSRAVPLRDATGAVTQWLATSTDISEIVEAREAAARHEADLEILVADRTRALSDAAQELAQEIRRREEVQAMLLQTRKLEALGQLTGGVAYDFSNILAAIMASYSAIRRHTDSRPLLDVVARGELAAERASALVRQLLTLARKQELMPQALDVRAIIGEADDLIAHTIGRRIRRVVDIAGDVWPMMADPQQLEVALLNLAVNARDAMPDGGTLTLSARNLKDEERPVHLQARAYVAIGVRDTGYGMAPSVAARATEPFFTTKEPGKGTGLGLAMVHSFAEQSGGCLLIDSQVGVGTGVEIILPRSDHETVPEADVEEPPELDLALHGGAMVLVVEPDDAVRQATAGMLRELRYTVVEARNAEVAQVLVYALERLDLVITGIEMPGDDGPTLAARLRAERPNLPVLFMTREAPGPALASETLLFQPFTHDALARAVLERLGRQSLVAQMQPTGSRSLLARVRTVALRDLYFAWNGLRAGDTLPAPAELHPAEFGLERHSFLLSVRRNGEMIDMRFLSAGVALTTRLGRDLAGEQVGTNPRDGEVLGSLEAAYRRCARDRQPVYQFIRFDFGDGSPTRFERLLLPLAERGQEITHLLGVTLFDESSI